MARANLTVSDELAALFVEAQSGDVRCIFATVEGEELVSRGTCEASGTAKDDFPRVCERLGDGEPRFVLYRLDSEAGDPAKWAFISYVPEETHVRPGTAPAGACTPMFTTATRRAGPHQDAIRFVLRRLQAAAGTLFLYARGARGRQGATRRLSRSRIPRQATQSLCLRQGEMVPDLLDPLAGKHAVDDVLTESERLVRQEVCAAASRPAAWVPRCLRTGVPPSNVPFSSALPSPPAENDGARRAVGFTRHGPVWDHRRLRARPPCL